ncbi:phosphatidylserine decarboxylase-domain-containing protein [Choanephora cucurbitarum]|nr:phosphatidylserine decarboxylase-domain-containing protein [Choanephora cucurbitarum]
MTETKQELIFKVDIIEARSLSKDDEVVHPYAQITYGGIKHKTDTIKKTQQPNWNCSFEFDLNDILSHKRRARSLKDHGLTLSIYNKDRFTSVFLGQTHWSLEELFSGQSVAYEENSAKWHPLSHVRHHKRFRLRKRREDTSASEAEQAEVHVRYGLIGKHDQTAENIAAEWQNVLSMLSVQEVPSPPELQSSSSTSSANQESRTMVENSSTLSVSSTNTPKTARPRRKLRSKFSRRGKSQKRAGYYSRFLSKVTGVTFLEIESANDLPPERNLTRTGFDMDPFVIVTYGVNTFRTSAIRHNLNPVWNEKLFFHVRSSQENYKIKFAVYDKDKFSSNDFVASQEIKLSDIVNKTLESAEKPVEPENMDGDHTPADEIDRNMARYSIPLTLARPDKWPELQPKLTIRAKFVPYVEIRKLFWTALAKTCDADSSNTMSKLEVQTMLETLGSNISECTIDRFWKENNKDLSEDLTMDELVNSLEALLLDLDERQKRVDVNALIESGQDVPKDIANKKLSNPFFPNSSDDESVSEAVGSSDTEDDYDSDMGYDSVEYDESISTSPETPDEADYEVLAEADGVQYVDDSLESLKIHENEKQHEHKDHNAHLAKEKLIHLTECPICHKTDLTKRMQMDTITHVAICAANDWTTVDQFLIGNFGSEAQAQRRWFVKLVSKVGYGKYSEGENNANIIVQDRSTGLLIDERMSVYVRLGMRLLYKGKKTGIHTKAAHRILANMSIKQGRRFDNPNSVREIAPFIKFHRLDLSEVLEPIENFKTFNEFFYRKLKPGSRPCDNPEDKRVAVSTADCRMMAFPTVDDATRIWIKGVEFSLAKLLDDEEEAKTFEGGALAIFRLAPQDYHRYHSPVDGTVRKIHHVKGEYYTVNPMAIRTTLDVYGDNKRDVVYMDTEVFGRVAIVCIGAMMVGSIVLTAKEGDYLARTDELGYFAFGGSTLVVLFEKDSIQFDTDLIDNANRSLETLVRVGNHIGVHP